MDLLRTYRLVPLEEGEGYIKLLVPKDFDPLVLEEVRFSLGKEIIPVYVSEEEFSQRLQEVLAQEEPLVEVEGAEESEVRDILYEEETSPAVSFVNQTLIKAINLGASDIHIEPYEGQSFVRLRLDGMLHNYTQIPLSLHEQVVEGVISQIKLFNAGSGWRTLTCVLVYVYAYAIGYSYYRRGELEV